MQISVIGSSNPSEEETLQLAEKLGREIAKEGAFLICGGREGVMKASCKGAKSEGGTTIGILPGSKTKANEFVDIKIPTNLGPARNAIVAGAGDAVIAVGGSIGTLIEILYSSIYGKKIILLESREGISGQFNKLEGVPEIKKKIKECGAEIIKVKTPKEAVKRALQ